MHATSDEETPVDRLGMQIALLQGTLAGSLLWSRSGAAASLRRAQAQAAAALSISARSLGLERTSDGLQAVAAALEAYDR